MSIIETIHECLQTTTLIDNEHNESGGDVTADTSSSSLESFIVVLHKRTGGNPMVPVTRFFMSDLWLLSKVRLLAPFLHAILTIHFLAIV
jgi:hypothetical protein